MKAYCWASGLIQFGHKKPEGAIVFAKGPAKPLREVVEVLARHGQGNSKGQLLVPGVPEAEALGKDPVESVIALSKEVGRRFADLGLIGPNKLPIKSRS